MQCTTVCVFVADRLEQFQGDLIAGITVGLTVIPQSLAYAKIAELPPQVSNGATQQKHHRHHHHHGSSNQCVGTVHCAAE
jgi:Sulfate permease family